MRNEFNVTLAKVCALNVFLNDDRVQKLHTTNGKMSSLFYNAMADSIDANVHDFKRGKTLFFEQSTRPMFTRAVIEDKATNRYRVSEFFNNIMRASSPAGVVMSNGEVIKSPIDVEAYNNDNNTAEYLLSGKFKQYCDERKPLNKEVLGEIYNDIVNRAFTMLENYTL